METVEKSYYSKYGKKYRATEKGRKIYNEYKKRYYNKTATNGHLLFTAKEDKLILEHNMTDTELSKLIKHSVMSIQIRRSRLKKKLKNGGI